MNCILWNFWGANKPNFRRSIRYLVKKSVVGIIALFETHTSGTRADRICQRMGFTDNFRVEAGGIWLLWRGESVSLCIVASDQQYIHAEVKLGNDKVNLFTMYACSTPARRRHLWNPLLKLIFVGGDFNSILKLDELSLVDLGFKGNRFTWMRGRIVEIRVAKRLDRVFCCTRGRLKWQKAGTMLLYIFNLSSRRLVTPLDARSALKQRVSHTRNCKNFSRHLGLMFMTLLFMIIFTLEKPKSWLSYIRRSSYFLMWSQPSCWRPKIVCKMSLISSWIKRRFFGTGSREKNGSAPGIAILLIRRRRNLVESLKNDQGHWITEPRDLESMASLPEVSVLLPKSSFAPLSASELVALNKSFSSAEIEKSGTASFKSQDQKGSNPFFINVVGKLSVIFCVQKFFNSGVLPAAVNDTVVMLLSKSR
ncbi:LOW QUALITY PROTEIN: hypothetical protein V2J09_018721 [Rumex salicifolius]